jgi:DNA polymerase I
MVIRKAYLLDVDYTVRNGQSYVRLLVKGKKAARLYYRYDPYFYAEIPSERKEELLNMSAYAKDGGRVSPKDVLEAELQWGQKSKRLVKVVCKAPSDVPILRGAIPFPCYEDGIPFGRRFIFDMRLTPLGIIRYEREKQLIKRIISCEQAVPKLATLAFDIETYNPAGAPREKVDPVIMVSWSGADEGVLTTKPDKRGFVRTLGSEKAMLEEFGRLVREQDPDVVFGYNSANFDLPYLDTRARATGAAMQLGRYKGQLRQVRRGLTTGVKIAGRIHVDIYPMLRFFGHIGMIKVPDYTLRTVAALLTKSGKKDMKRDDIWKLWDSNDIGELAEYSLVDSKVTKEIGDRYLQVEAELSSLAKLPLYDTSLATSGQLVENLLMFEATGKGMLIPPKPAGGAIADRLAAPIQGAYVKLPEPGVYENIAVLDFRGLYPSIIVAYNIDPGTLVAGGSGAAGGGTNASPTGAEFLKSPKGLIPSVLDHLIDVRSKIKRELKTLDKDSDAYRMLHARSNAIKVVSNSFYGYLAYARSRWYSRECGESVTAYGRKHIMETMDRAEKAGFRVLYGDTDSVMLIYSDKEDVLKFMKDMNDSLPEKMELELEGFYPRGVFVSKKGGGEKGAKKKYALLGDDNRIKIRGFELVRRDWSQIAKKTQLAVLEAILRDGSKEKAVKIVRETVERINSGKVPMDELAIVTQLKKDPRGGYEVQSPELSAAQKGLGRGMAMETGSVVSYIITKKGKSISEKAELAEFAKDYDPDYYINNQVLPSVMKILKELGYDEYSLKVGGRQKTLDLF